MRSVAARRARAGLACATVGILGLSIGGCVTVPPTIAVAGHDANGTLVAGGAGCDDFFTTDTLRVLRNVDGVGRRTVWRITTSDTDRTASTSLRPGRERLPAAPPATPVPPRPDPRRVGGVSLVAVGDPAPPGWTTSHPLVGALPSTRRIVVEVFDSTGLGNRAAVEVEVRGRANRFTARVGEEAVATEAGPVATSRAIREACNRPPVSLTRFLLLLAALGIGSLVASGFVAWGIARWSQRGRTPATGVRARPGRPGEETPVPARPPGRPGT